MKIIASDYDGTLNHGGIDDKKRNAIKKWREMGNKFGILQAIVQVALKHPEVKDQFRDYLKQVAAEL